MEAEDHITETALQSDIHSILEGAAIAVLSDRAFLRITGLDAIRWLNGMVTNSIQALQPGEGNYSFLLNAQGRIQGDCTIYREAGDIPSFLLVTTGDQIETIHQLLDKFIIMDDVELARAYTEEQSVLLVGADSANVLQHLGLPALQPLRLVLASTSVGDVLLLSGFFRGTPHYEIRSAPAVVAQLNTKAAAWGAQLMSAYDLEALRIISGEPHFSVDIRDRDLPQETNQRHALHFAKGCYLGQEIVERIRSRGQVHRVFTAFSLDGSLPQVPATLHANDKPAGELTSAIQVGTQLYALGYTRRDILDTGQPITYEGGSATPRTIANSTSIQEDETHHG